MSGPAQPLATCESHRAAAADLCARVWRDLGVLRRLCKEAGLDAEEDFLGEMASDFDKLATRLSETAKRG